MRSVKFLAALAFLAFLTASQAEAQNASLRSFNDCSIAALSGASQQILPANPNRSYLLICNTATTNNAGVNFTGGTAVIGGAGTYTLLPNNVAQSCKEYAAGFSYLPPPPSGAINVIGTATQTLLCLEGR
jgi:hypothetical protein